MTNLLTPGYSATGQDIKHSKNVSQPKVIKSFLDRAMSCSCRIKNNARHVHYAWKAKSAEQFKESII